MTVYCKVANVENFSGKYHSIPLGKQEVLFISDIFFHVHPHQSKKVQSNKDQGNSPSPKSHPFLKLFCFLYHKQESISQCEHWWITGFLSDRFCYHRNQRIEKHDCCHHMDLCATTQSSLCNYSSPLKNGKEIVCSQELFKATEINLAMTVVTGYVYKC